MKLLDFIDCSNGHCTVCGQSQAVWVCLCIERTHVFDLAQVNVREDQFLGGGVNDGGPVGARKDIHCRMCPKENKALYSVRPDWAIY